MLECANRKFDGKLERLGMLGKKQRRSVRRTQRLACQCNHAVESAAKRHTYGHTFSELIADLQCVQQQWMYVREPSTRKRIGIQFGMPVQVFNSATKGNPNECTMMVHCV